MADKIVGCIYLDEDDVKEIHEVQLAQFGGQGGVRNPDGLSSAIAQPQMPFGDEDLYPDIFLKASVLAFGIAESQSFIDGNKRTGLVSALTFLAINGHDVPPAEERLYDAMMDVANKKMSKEELADLLRELVCEYNARSFK